MERTKIAVTDVLAVPSSVKMLYLQDIDTWSLRDIQGNVNSEHTHTATPEFLAPPPHTHPINGLIIFNYSWCVLAGFECQMSHLFHLSVSFREKAYSA